MAKTHVAIFEGGPAHGQTRAMQADFSADDPRDRDDPPLVVTVAQMTEGAIRMVMYLRYKDKNEQGHWRYAFVPPESP